MNVRALVRLASLALLGSICAVENQAQAFCRATTIEGKRDSCLVCEDAGYPLAWDHASIDYTFNEQGFPGFSDANLRSIFSEAVDKWQAVTCDGARVEIDVGAASGTTPLGPREKEISPQVNVMGYLTGEEWADQDYEPHAFAQTGVRYYPDSGVIAGADIWFNGGIGQFGECPSSGCSDNNMTVDLPNVVTHEVGHFYGLAHSHIEGATMGCDAQPGDTNKRSLAADDRKGMCAIYPPDIAFRGAYEQGKWQEPDDPDCSVRAPGLQRGEHTLSVLGLALAALFWLRRPSARARSRTRRSAPSGARAKIRRQVGRGSS